MVKNQEIEIVAQSGYSWTEQITEDMDIEAVIISIIEEHGDIEVIRLLPEDTMLYHHN